MFARFLALALWAALVPSVLAAQPVTPGLGTEGDAFQVVLAPGLDGRTLVYLADLESNAPINDASIDAEAEGWSGKAVPAEGPGAYVLNWMPPLAGIDLTLMVSAQGRDDLLLARGVAPLPLPPAPPAPVEHWRHWAGGAAIGAVLVVGAWWLGRHRAGAAVILLLLAIPAARAHEGHDHGAPAAEAPAAQPGALLVMAKPTQFLLGIRTQKVQSAEAAETVRVVGRVVPDPAGFARVQPSQPARIVSDPEFPLPVPGQSVKRGQVIGVLEPTLSTLERSDKRASLYRVESEIAITERESARQEALKGLVATKLVEDTRTRLDQLRRERGQLLGTALGRDLMRAPIDGVVTDVHVVPGEVVPVDKAMIEIVDPVRVRVEAVIHDLALATRIGAATAATKLLPDEAVTLSLLGVSPRVDALDQGVHAIFAVPEAQARNLRIGMPVDVFLATGATRLRMAVPRSAIAESGGRQVVFVRTNPETFEARPIRVERVVGPLAEIEGVKAGEKVVIQGVEQLKALR
ncbi:Membrane-fusion protein [Paramagnetospirillum magnetotacticum MS-1]|uniref:Membrane-fusion protein n=1 Tax=Paramagnetospirillum magnetotacticum MS-1 TaxID=272627 RepID=A0A0C2UE90_PARME|nr:efflux RND transporter periplasmic adaptor subunit [Paramagnetospirillum magnetotacticum]KIL99822.1 Membrane-fusion protein [Paramagnetospirillum magnetotacticum MS-1]